MLKRFLLLLNLLGAFAFNDLLAAPPSFIPTEDRIIVYTDTDNAGKPEVTSGNSIRVIVVPGKIQTAIKKFSTRKRTADKSLVKSNFYTPGDQQVWMY